MYTAVVNGKQVGEYPDAHTAVVEVMQALTANEVSGVLEYVPGLRYVTVGSEDGMSWYDENGELVGEVRLRA